MPIEGVPRKLHEPSHEVEKQRLRSQVFLLDGGGEVDVSKAEKMPTILDLQGLDMQNFEANSEEEEEHFLRWIRKVLGVDAELVEKGKSTRESEEFYTKLNIALAKAKDFLWKTLAYPENQSTKISEVNSLNSKEDIFSLLRKTKLSGPKQGLSRSIIYCRLVKVAIAEYRLLTSGVLELAKTKQMVEDIVTTSPFSSSREGVGPIVQEDDKRQEFYLSSNPEIKGSIESRIKTIDGAMLRFVNRPDANERAALEDANAFRLSAKGPIEAFILFKEIFNSLNKSGRVLGLRTENKKVLTPNSIREAKKIGIQIEDVKKTKFEGLIIKGFLNSKDPNNQFEIQIVLADNKNEEGALHHNIFDVRKKIMACTRLSGGCSRVQLDKFIEVALYDPTLDKKLIEDTLLKGYNAPIVRLKTNDGKEIFVDREVYQRWNGLKWVDGPLADRII